MGCFTSPGVIYSGHEDADHANTHGVAIMATQSAMKACMEWNYVSLIIITARFKSTGRNVSVTQCYVSVTQCYVSVTQCYVSATQCYVSVTQCYVSVTQCYVSVTQCYVSVTQCYVSVTQCYVSVTQCYVM